MKYNIRIRWKNNSDEVGREYATRFLFLTMQELEREAKRRAPIFEGHLKRSIQFTPTQPGQTRYVLYSDKAYAKAMEFGTEPPHPIPPDAYKDLERWARIKLGDAGLAYPIAQKIEEEGLTAHPFLRPALQEVRQNKMDLIRRRALNHIERKYRGRTGL